MPWNFNPPSGWIPGLFADQDAAFEPNEMKTKKDSRFDDPRVKELLQYIIQMPECSKTRQGIMDSQLSRELCFIIFSNWITFK